ncbi:MAG: hypothetical protein L6V83_02865 [Christensenella sp.]|nr:MAG: hypothetical protein L6V83_02865 [Christensenella sp.]
MQLTDIHIGGSLATRKKDKLALAAVEKIVNASNADFVVVTGGYGVSDAVAQSGQFQQP